MLQDEISLKTLLPKTKQAGVRVRYSEALDLSKQSNFTAEMTELCFERRSNAWYRISAQRRRIGERKTAHVAETLEMFMPDWFKWPDGEEGVRERMALMEAHYRGTDRGTVVKARGEVCRYACLARHH